MISSTSRYTNSQLITAKKNDGSDVISITPSKAVAFTFSFSFYVVTGSDRIDNISNAFYGDPTKWWRIADANPEIMKWDNLTPGIVIRIPNS